MNELNGRLQEPWDMSWEDACYQGSRLGSLEPGEEPWGGGFEEHRFVDASHVTSDGGYHHKERVNTVRLAQCHCGARFVRLPETTCGPRCRTYKPLERESLISQGGPK